MSSDFEKMMNEKMKQAKLSELMPGFDRDAEWEQLEKRIPEKKTRVLPVWWTHAAAVVAGLLIGGSFLLLQNDEPQSTVVTQQDEQPVKEIEVQTIKETDTVYIAKEVEVIKTVPATPTATKPVLKPEPATTPEQQQEELTEVVAQESPVNPAIPVPEVRETPAPKRKEIKVVHLLDIDNEDRQSALNHYDPSQAQRSGFVLQISTKRLPDENSNRPKSLLNSIRKTNQ